MTTNYVREYKKFISSEKRTARSRIVPNRLYKITLYKKVDDTIKKLSGDEEDLVFAVGIDSGLLHCLKLNNLKPTTFFTWLNKATIDNAEADEIKTLDEIIRRVDKKGHQLFERYIKPSTFYKTNKDVYRTYRLSGIRYIKEVELTNETFKQKLNAK